MKLIKAFNNVTDKVLDRVVGKTTAQAGPAVMACRCVYNPAICTGGHERLCDGNFAGCC